jgi:hypothetical protein
MSKTKHTPGTWVIEDRAKVVVVGEDGLLIAEEFLRHRKTIEGIHNALLVAAAPDLLKAAELYISARALAFATCDGNSGVSVSEAASACDACDAAMRAAIAKAKGE